MTVSKFKRQWNNISKKLYFLRVMSYVNVGSVKLFCPQEAKVLFCFFKSLNLFSCLAQIHMRKPTVFLTSNYFRQVFSHPGRCNPQRLQQRPAGFLCNWLLKTSSAFIFVSFDLTVVEFHAYQPLNHWLFGPSWGSSGSFFHCNLCTWSEMWAALSHESKCERLWSCLGRSKAELQKIRGLENCVIPFVECEKLGKYIFHTLKILTSPFKKRVQYTVQFSKESADIYMGVNKQQLCEHMGQ